MNLKIKKKIEKIIKYYSKSKTEQKSLLCNFCNMYIFRFK